MAKRAFKQGHSPNFLDDLALESATAGNGNVAVVVAKWGQDSPFRH